MAMGRDSIAECRSDVSYFNSSWENQNYKATYESIQGDPEYQKFVSQTELGKELNVKLGSMLDLYGELWNTLGDLGDKTRAFLNVQEALNNGDEATRDINSGNSISSGSTTHSYNPGPVYSSGSSGSSSATYSDGANMSVNNVSGGGY